MRSGLSMPAAIPVFGSFYSTYVSKLGSEEQSELLKHYQSALFEEIDNTDGKILFFRFYLSFLSRTFSFHRVVSEERGSFFTLPLLPPPYGQNCLIVLAARSQ